MIISQVYRYRLSNPVMEEWQTKRRSIYNTLTHTYELALTLNQSVSHKPMTFRGLFDVATSKLWYVCHMCLCIMETLKFTHLNTFHFVCDHLFNIYWWAVVKCTVLRLCDFHSNEIMFHRIFRISSHLYSLFVVTSNETQQTTTCTLKTHSFLQLIYR